MDNNKKKWSVGDRVAFEQYSGVWVLATIIEVDNSSGFSTMLKLKLNNNTVTTAHECSVVPIPKGATYVNLSMIKCECGLKYVRDGGRHSTWCPLYKKDE